MHLQHIVHSWFLRTAQTFFHTNAPIVSSFRCCHLCNNWIYIIHSCIVTIWHVCFLWCVFMPGYATDITSTWCTCNQLIFCLISCTCRFGQYNFVAFKLSCIFVRLWVHNVKGINKKNVLCMNYYHFHINRCYQKEFSATLSHSSGNFPYICWS